MWNRGKKNHSGQILSATPSPSKSTIKILLFRKACLSIFWKQKWLILALGEPKMLFPPTDSNILWSGSSSRRLHPSQSRTWSCHSNILSVAEITQQFSNSTIQLQPIYPKVPGCSQPPVFNFFSKLPLLWMVQMGDFLIFSSNAEHIAERERLLQLVHTQVTENEKFSQSTVKRITFEWCQNTRSSDLSDKAVLWKYNLLFFPKRKVQQMTGNTPRTSF